MHRAAKLLHYLTKRLDIDPDLLLYSQVAPHVSCEPCLHEPPDGRFFGFQTWYGDSSRCLLLSWAQTPYTPAGANVAARIYSNHCPRQLLKHRHS